MIETRADEVDMILQHQLNRVWDGFVSRYSMEFEHCLHAFYQAVPNVSSQLAQYWLMMWAIATRTPDKVFHHTLEDREKWQDKAWQPVLAFLCEYIDLPPPTFSAKIYRDPTYIRQQQDSPTIVLSGLWNVSPKTVKRRRQIFERQLIQLLQQQETTQQHTEAIRYYVTQRFYERDHLTTVVAQHAWHRQQAISQQQAGAYIAALWHWRQVHALSEIYHLIRTYYVQLVQDTALDQELNRLENLLQSQSEWVNYYIVWAFIYAARHDEAKEHNAYNQARYVATHPNLDERELAVVYRYLGKFYETRDRDRAAAYYRDSLTLFQKTETAVTHSEYIRATIGLAWLYALEHDPRAHDLLIKAEALNLPSTSLEKAWLAKAWGRYYRHEQTFTQALVYLHQALNIYELLDDKRGIVGCYNNLGVIYDDLKQIPQAITYYERVLNMAHSGEVTVEPQILVSAQINLGAAYFALENYEDAIQTYQTGLRQSQEANLTLFAGHGHYNLAEVFHRRYQIVGNELDRQQALVHVEAAIQTFRDGNYAVKVAHAIELQKVILDDPESNTAVMPSLYKETILPREMAAYPEEMQHIHKNRQSMDQTVNTTYRVQAHLAISSAYLTISQKEWQKVVRADDIQLDIIDEAIDKLRLQLDEFAKELDQMATKKENLYKIWHSKVDNTIQTDYWTKALDFILETGYIANRDYVNLCFISSAKAWRDLKKLSELGLIIHQGKGRNAVYVLPE